VTSSANIINHIGLELDASYSMTRHKQRLVEQADGLIKHLAARSEELDQETRISVWTFSDADDIRCLVWDKDVLRLPSIRDLYRIGGNTALVDATFTAIEDLETTSQRHGDHSFLLYVLTDGEENRSVRFPRHERAPRLSARIGGLPDNWTVATLVPNISAVSEAKRFGFPAGNIETWDTASAYGASEAGARIRETADAYMAGRARGERSTRNLFSTGPDAVNDQTVRAAGLTPMRQDAYQLVEVERDASIRDFVETRLHQPYQLRRAFYELMKREEIQNYKEVLVMDRATGRVFSGPGARDLIGLPPDVSVKVTPSFNPNYKIFVQSTSVSRRLKAGTEFIYVN
jgi:hypothetical protein